MSFPTQLSWIDTPSNWIDIDKFLVILKFNLPDEYTNVILAVLLRMGMLGATIRNLEGILGPPLRSLECGANRGSNFQLQNISVNFSTTSKHPNATELCSRAPQNATLITNPLRTPQPPHSNINLPTTLPANHKNRLPPRPPIPPPRQILSPNPHQTRRNPHNRRNKNSLHNPLYPLSPRRIRSDPPPCYYKIYWTEEWVYRF